MDSYKVKLPAGMTSTNDEKTSTNGRKQYSAPQLQILGDLRTTTLGGTPGNADSGGQSSFDPFGFPL